MNNGGRLSSGCSDVPAIFVLLRKQVKHYRTADVEDEMIVVSI